MGLKNRISKFSGKMTKEKWLLLLLVGVLLMILSFLVYNTSFISLVASMNLSISSKSFLGVTLA